LLERILGRDHSPNARPRAISIKKDAATRSGINLGILKRDQRRGKIEFQKIGYAVYVSIASLDDFTVAWNSREHRSPVAWEIVAATPPELLSLRDLLEALQRG
jgi:hypothetical protein